MNYLFCSHHHHQLNGSSSSAYRKYFEFHFVQAGQSVVAPRITIGKFFATKSRVNSNDVGIEKSSGIVSPKYKPIKHE